MAAAHPKPSTINYWRWDTARPGPPDASSSGCVIQGRFTWPTGGEDFFFAGPPTLIYVPYGTDFRVSLSDPDTNDLVSLGSVPNMVYRLAAFEVINPDTPEKEVRLFAILSEATAPYTTL